MRFAYYLCSAGVLHYQGAPYRQSLVSLSEEGKREIRHTEKEGMSRWSRERFEDRSFDGCGHKSRTTCSPQKLKEARSRLSCRASGGSTALLKP